MDILDDEILNLWSRLESNKVLYIMVGGFASSLHGYIRATSDVDIWIKDTPENRRSLRKTLSEIEIGDFESIETTQFIPGFTSITLNSGFELDIMTSLTGFEQESFDACYDLAPTAIVEGISVKFLHINHLIENKKLTSRNKDKIDVEELEKIRKSSENTQK